MEKGTLLRQTRKIIWEIYFLQNDTLVLCFVYYMYTHWNKLIFDRKLCFFYLVYF